MGYFGEESLQPDWQRRRSIFNHDWLKNVYLPALDSWLNVLDGEIEDSGFETKFLLGRFREWTEHREEARSLVEEFEAEMSPGGLLEESPLQRLPERDHRWLRSVIHAAWKARTGHESVLRQIDESLGGVNATFDELSQRLADLDSPTTEDLRPLRDHFAILTAHCRELSQAVSRLPSRGLVA